MGKLTIVMETSVILELLRLNRIELVRRNAEVLVVTDHVAAEVADHFPDLLVKLKRSFRLGIVRQESVSGKNELSLFLVLSKIRSLGSGECSAIAFAVCNNFILATDSRIAAKQVAKINPDLRVLNSRSIMESIPQMHRISEKEAKLRNNPLRYVQKTKHDPYGKWNPPNQSPDDLAG